MGGGAALLPNMMGEPVAERLVGVGGLLNPLKLSSAVVFILEQRPERLAMPSARVVVGSMAEAIAVQYRSWRGVVGVAKQSV